MIETLKNDILNKSESPETYYNIGIMHTKNNKLDDAINAYKKAISLKPDYVEAYFNIGRVFYDLGK